MAVKIKKHALHRNLNHDHLLFSAASRLVRCACSCLLRQPFLGSLRSFRSGTSLTLFLQLPLFAELGRHLATHNCAFQDGGNWLRFIYSSWTKKKTRNRSDRQGRRRSENETRSKRHVPEANTARSWWCSNTGVLCVWKPVMVRG